MASKTSAPSPRSLTRDIESMKSFWGKRLRKIDRSSKLLQEQLEGIEPRFPETAAAFKSLVAYIGFLHRAPQYREAFGDPPPMPDNWCITDVQACQCAAGNKVACGEYPPLRQTGTVSLSRCQQLWAAYTQAVQQQRDALHQFLQSGRMGVPVLVEGQSETDRLWDELLKNGCLTRIRR